MGSDIIQVHETTLHTSCVKVHEVMCAQLLSLLDSISGIFPDIVAAQPRCTAGIKALCLLQNAIEKARKLLQNCCESSKLYLALTGDTIVSRFEKTKNHFQQSLTELQSMVPVVLQLQISDILQDLSVTKFQLDSDENEAGKALRGLLEQDTSSVMTSARNSPAEVLQFAAFRLRLTTQKDLLIERRSIRKILKEVTEENSTKTKTLKYLSYILKKNERLLVQGKQPENPSNIQKDLSSLFVQHGILLSDTPNMQTSVYDDSLESSSNSISSNASSMRDIHMRVDISNLSIGSLDSSYSSGFSNPKVQKFGFYRSIGEIKRRVLFNVSDLPWESRCRAVQDVNDYLIEYNPSCSFVSSENFMEPLVQFLKDAADKQDMEAQKAGIQLLLTFLKSNRREATYASEDVYSLITSFLEKQPSVETLAILDVLSLETSALTNLAKYGALALIVELLDSYDKEVYAAAIRILHNLSLNINTHSLKLASNWIPKLVPFLRESSTAGTCIRILENLSQFEEGRICIVHTDSCISSMVELLETGNSNDQEIITAILLSLCSQRDQYCHLVLKEGILPALCLASVNGTEKGKASAGELLRLLMDVKSENEQEKLPPPTRSNSGAFVDRSEERSEKKSSSKFSGSFGRKMKMLFKKK